jgi:peptidoglycan-N-acetylglucosamine deacetylase
MFRIPSILPWLFPQLTWRVDTQQKELFLTFDDGPIPGPTEFVLNELKKYQAKATFFCIGDNIHKHPKVFERIISEGHQIGNHTFNHMKGWGTSTEKYVMNVEQCAMEIANWLPVPGFQFPVSSSGSSFTGNRHPGTCPLFRPPYGRIRPKQINALKSKYQIVMWDVLTSDYSQSLSPERCLAGSIKATRAGSIIVFHDSLKAEKNMTYALPRFLQHFSSLGYSFNTLPLINPNFS